MKACYTHTTVCLFVLVDTCVQLLSVNCMLLLFKCVCCMYCHSSGSTRGGSSRNSV